MTPIPIIIFQKELFLIILKQIKYVDLYWLYTDLYADGCMLFHKRNNRRWRNPCCPPAELSPGAVGFQLSGQSDCWLVGRSVRRTVSRSVDHSSSGWSDGQSEGRSDGRADRQSDGRAVGWMDRRKASYLLLCDSSAFVQALVPELGPQSQWLFLLGRSNTFFWRGAPYYSLKGW